MIADLDQAPKERVEKPVWRVAFFGRLEERKGIKLFVDAVQVSHVHWPNFQLPGYIPSREHTTLHTDQHPACLQLGQY